MSFRSFFPGTAAEPQIELRLLALRLLHSVVLCIGRDPESLSFEFLESLGKGERREGLGGRGGDYYRIW